MIVYNVTIKIDLDSHDAWLKWMKEVHIPDVMETKHFVENRMFRILEQDETDGITYSIQYYANTFSDYMDYKENHAERLQQLHKDAFEGKTVAFRSLMRMV